MTKCKMHNACRGSLWLLMVASVLSLFILCPVYCQDVKQILEAYDYEFLSKYVLEMECYDDINLYAGATPEYATRSVRMTGNDINQFAIIKLLQSPAFSFHEGEKSTRYDEQGNYQALLPWASILMLNNDYWKQCDLIHSAAINDGGVIVSQKTEPIRSIYKPGSEAPDMNYYKYILPLGRGFSQRIDKIEDVNLTSDGVAIVKARGHHFFDQDKPWRFGNWRFEVDTKNKYLVRNAVFVTDELGQVTTYRSGTAIYNGVENLPLYENGATYTGDESNFFLRVHLRSFKAEYDDSLRGICEDEFSRHREKKPIVYDYTNSTDGHVPLLYPAMSE